MSRSAYHHVVALVVALSLSPALPLDAQKGKPSPPPDALGSVTLANRPGDQITSDDQGQYGGAIIYGGGTLWLDLGAQGRAMKIALLSASKGLTDPDTDHLAADVTYDTDAVFRIDNIRHAPTTGGWVRSTGRVGFGTSAPNHALGFRYATANGVPIYGTDVCVKRVDDTSLATPATWQIASSDACSQTGEEGQAGVFEEGLKGKGYRFEAVYKVKFLATVVCTSGSTCPQ